MSELERIKEYGKSIRDIPVPSDFAVVSAAKEFYGIELEESENKLAEVERLRQWIYHSKSPDRGCNLGADPVSPSVAQKSSENSKK